MENPKSKKPKTKKQKIIFWSIVATILVVIFLFINSLFHSSSSNVFNYILPNKNNLSSTDDRVNVLLLGNAGGNYPGSELTDSIIVASYNLKTNKVVMFSIPRDFWLDNIEGKINSAYERGEEDRNGGAGLPFAKEKIGEVLGLPIHYGVRINFSGFAKAIDLVEGVDIDVPTTFDDYSYPDEKKANDSCGLIEKEMEVDASTAAKLSISPGKKTVWTRPDGSIATEQKDFGCRFEHLHFDKGLTHMDGTTALKFVRSRQGTNGEGSDFARSRRQQLVIQAFREKVLSMETLFNPQKIIGLVQTFGDNFETDIKSGEYLDFYKVLQKISGINSIVLGDLGKDKSVLISPPPADYGGAYVLIPEEENSIKDFVKKQLDDAAIAEDKK